MHGTVTDGSGHGWPLYAKITAKGVPGGPVFTNPVTGKYSLQLAAGADYTLSVSSVYPGYQQESEDRHRRRLSANRIVHPPGRPGG